VRCSFEPSVAVGKKAVHRSQRHIEITEKSGKITSWQKSAVSERALVAPKGPKQSALEKIAKQVALTGKTPLEVMLDAMRFYQNAGNRDKASAIAKLAAPYMRPRLNSVNVGGIPGSPIETNDISVPELARRLAFIFNQAALEKKAGLIEGAGDGGD
jgi:hypothetical protein